LAFLLKKNYNIIPEQILHSECIMTIDKQFGHDDYEILKREELYKGIFGISRYTLRHRLFKEGWSNDFKLELFERKSAVAILPYDPILDRVILIEQFRIGALNDAKSPWLIEIPAGVIESGEAPDDVAHRETEEEAGCKLLELTPIYRYFVSPGGSNEYLHLYYGRVDASHIEGIHGLENENEDIRVLNISRVEAFELLHDGKIKNAPTIIALQWLALNSQLTEPRPKGERVN
jgi:ADP-ribose pyrophosphatase